jgi:hypothetical protein
MSEIQRLYLDTKMKIYIISIILIVSLSLFLLFLIRTGIYSDGINYILNFFALLCSSVIPIILVTFMISYKKSKEIVID